MNVIKIALAASALVLGTSGAFAESQRAGGGFYETRNAITEFGKAQKTGDLTIFGQKRSEPTIFGHMAQIEDVRSRETQNQ